MSNFAEINFNNKQALIRVDFNVPLNERFEITDDTRIQSALPTIQKILADGGRVVLMSHLGRPKAQEEEFSLKHIVPHLSYVLKVIVKFTDDCISDDAFAKSAALQNGEVLLLNNLRYYKEEKAGDKAFAEKLAKHGEIYVNDAFGTAHRAHASTAVIAQFFAPENSCFGYLMEKEVVFADKLLKHAEKPFVAITGGAKVSDKIAILENLIGKADHIIVGGGMAYTFLKALGGNIGDSICEDDRMPMALDILEKAKQQGTTIHLPVDNIAADDFAPDANTQTVQSNEIPDNWQGLDIGPKSIEEFKQIVEQAKSILWNGPMGVFEMEQFATGTKAIAQAVATATENGAFSLIGGGDSAAAINQLGFQDKVSHISTGGGALLELFEGKELPGIRAVQN